MHIRKLGAFVAVVVLAFCLSFPPAMAGASDNLRGIDRVARVSLLVKDQAEALRWYTDILGFEKRGDDRSRPGFWWLTVGPRSQADFEIVLLQASDEQIELVGKQPTAVLYTRDCRGTHELLAKHGVEFPATPADTAWGVSAVFLDLYGNAYNLLEPKQAD